MVARQFVVIGSTVFSDQELAAVTAPYIGRPLAAEDLEHLRQQLTLLYVNEGYLNSGALLPDQQIEDGVIRYQIVEGRLTDATIEGNRRFRDRYLESRILRGADTPLDVSKLAEQLELLQQDARIRHIEAELLPGERPGEARLRTTFEEESPLFAALEFSNHDSPSVGQTRMQIDLGNHNLTGWGDALRAMGAWNLGLWEGEVEYEIPITRWDTKIGARFHYGSSEVVEEPFDAIDITSRERTIAIDVSQPLYESVRNRLGIGLTAEYRETKTYLLDELFPFEEGTDDGQVVVSVIRASQVWLYRDLRQVISARSQFSLGVDALGATTDRCAFDLSGVCTKRAGIPDAHFLAWLGQLQLVRRFDPWGIEPVFRTDVQLATEPLFSLEQYAVGGHHTVRGYRENQLVRDNGLTSSLEVRIPVWTDAARELTVQLAPFCDAGRSWNRKRDEVSPRTLASVGVGLRTSWRRLHGELFWGHRIERVDKPDDHTLHDEGVHFAIAARF